MSCIHEYTPVYYNSRVALKVYPPSCYYCTWPLRRTGLVLYLFSMCTNLKWTEQYTSSQQTKATASVFIKLPEVCVFCMCMFVCNVFTHMCTQYTHVYTVYASSQQMKATASVFLWSCLRYVYLVCVYLCMCVHVCVVYIYISVHSIR